MTGTQPWTRVWALTACCVFCGALAGQEARAQAASSVDPVPGALIDIDLPAQPLAKALQAFGRMTHMLVMGETEQLGNRTSAPVNGDYTRQDALRLLLAGTGMSARFIDAQSVAILPLSPAEQRGQIPSPSLSVPASAIDGSTEDDVAYLTLIQARLTETLCESPQTRPGRYRLIVQLRIDSSGAVTASRVIGSTGDPARDEAIGQVLGGLVFDGGPPATFQQPVNILLRPQDDTVESGCGSAAQRG
jgi:hypothetical protein